METEKRNITSELSELRKIAGILRLQEKNEYYDIKSRCHITWVLGNLNPLNTCLQERPFGPTCEA